MPRFLIKNRLWCYELVNIENANVLNNIEKCTTINRTQTSHDQKKILSTQFFCFMVVYDIVVVIVSALILSTF